MKDPLVWIDLEMTGLDANNHCIVEVACLVTDADLVPVDEGVHCVIHQPDDMLEAMEDVVREMHERSGLLGAVRESVVDVGTAEQVLLTYVSRYLAPKTAPLCGNSIGTDRRFLSRYMPAFDEFLHYRSIDVSSVKELCRRWYPEPYNNRPRKSDMHRAAEDVTDSIAELRFYREHLFGDASRAAIS